MDPRCSQIPESRNGCSEMIPVHKTFLLTGHNNLCREVAKWQLAFRFRMVRHSVLRVALTGSQENCRRTYYGQRTAEACAAANPPVVL
ncbi:hypothetical protein TGPRC2_243355 [Toxoplasma gondii TgCatPRC2]|uniref:Uncharacterized protein n=14 Tax=Toxoplasma gondii TaxID=5811 RepID=A0A125YM66_TOXGV|nr:hypothetical protein TGME49_243355 [Toxoplasma gondii ME49]EPR56561.1 hypothetical protein TGGT1_243355 [Toxoplasma gondii GT1]ESS31701.1 hypothetical protein TGVEG_243355 [Toxoplasma gondii VEG]KFG33074.1 hypothetical protein TGDOM2_243355 [Toxoplasma gondii GAB2-2007-GAL-DOM2]KFG34246.1 hypothetical protein TGP89_243355 [Toxoplasma gondii p89]KFG51407.1 hypothetical protein TGFOU_243355 [Toxoplasma gondii FOU]KFG60220.1 hypothetical protein TGRUB_243355 [Toxoplasma gondii RUB]KFH04797.1|eukprot:XP_018637508.1 hypothetical protein TGME49_243355 [Toxoplasma gondii ME49]